MAFLRVGDMFRVDFDPDGDGRIALLNLEPTVASEAEVDSRISTHAGFPNVHHPQLHQATHGAGQPDAVSLDAAQIATGRFGRTRLEWTAGKLLKGAGPGADPVEIDIPADYPMKLEPALARWVIPGWYITSITSNTLAAGRIYYIPIFVSKLTTYIRIACRVTTASAGLADLRIFNWTDGLPSSLILAAGAVDTSTTGIKAIVISQSLDRGYYFLAIRADGTPTLSAASWDFAAHLPVPGFDTMFHASRRVILTADASFADPAPTPTGAVLMNCACVFLREN